MNSNLLQIVSSFDKSNKSRAQIEFILTNMGIIPEKIKNCLDKYYNKNKYVKMTIKETLNLKETIATLKEDVGKFSANTRNTYHITNIVNICEKYLNPLVAEANQDKIDGIIDNIKEQEKALVEYNNLIKESKKDLIPSEIESIIKKIDESKLALTNYTTNASNDFNKISHVAFAKGLIAELKVYDWIDPVSEFIRETEMKLVNNKLSTTVEESYFNLLNNKNANYYTKAISKLDELRKLDESTLSNNIKSELNDLKWVPEIKSIITESINLSNDIDDDKNNVVFTRYSYVLEHQDGLLFNLNRTNYIVKENSIEIADITKLQNALYLTLMAVEETFRFTDNSMITSKGNNIITITNMEDGPIIKMNENEIDITDGNQFRNFLYTSAGYRLNDKNVVETIVAAFENINKIKKLDFVKSISSRVYEGVQVNFMNIDNNIYLNKINQSMASNTFEKYDNAEDAVNIVKEFINYDISPLLIDKLSEEVKLKADKDALKAEVLDNIMFLKEKKEELSKADQVNEAIISATKLINEELLKAEEKYNKIVND